MDNDKLRLMALAGLLHDVGKLLERGEIFQEARQDDAYLASCPKGKGGWETHKHAAHTHQFLDWLEAQFLCLRELRDKSWKQWCAGHHLEHLSGVAAIVQIADRLSSGERDEGEYYQPDIHRKTRLEPVVERVFLGLNTNSGKTAHRYPLLPLTSAREGAFPQSAAELGVKAMPGAEGQAEPKRWDHLVAHTPLLDDYQRLGQKFLDEIEALAFKRKDLGLDALLTTLLTLLERYTANVPSATNLRHPDISLFDHLRTTAAIAQALYLYHQAHPGAPLQTKDDAKWLLVCGDFSGIQKFIYNLATEGAARGLRGRSFYVQFFCRIAGDYILRRLGLTRTALLYNSGGKFYLLIPAHSKPELYAARTTLNEWLLKHFSGDVFFGLGLAKVTADMFAKGNMHSAWRTAALDLERDRGQKFKEQLTPEFFNPQTAYDPTASCKVCGARSLSLKENICEMCRQLEKIGEWLKLTGALVTVWSGSDDSAPETGLPDTERSLDFPELGVKTYFIRPENFSALENASLNAGDCLFLNEMADKPLDELPLMRCGVQRAYLGLWDSQRPGDFSRYVNEANGVKRLGILRMDVDNLGLTFIKGLYFPQREDKGWGGIRKQADGGLKRTPMASISRMATLSRQLNQFFSGYVPTLLKGKEFEWCQTIYTGGDDLFMIGAWDQLPGLAKTIRSEFKAFCCHNPDFSISGGLTLIRDKYPLYKGALLAGDAEKQAKNLRQAWKLPGSPLKKDAFCFLNVPLAWEDMETAERIKGLLEAELDKNRGFLAFLSSTVAANKIMVRMLMAKGKAEVTAWESLAWAAWRWRTAYNLKRRYGKKEQQPTLEQWSEILFSDNGGSTQTSLPVYTWLELPVRWTEYLHRD